MNKVSQGLEHVMRVWVKKNFNSQKTTTTNHDGSLPDPSLAKYKSLHMHQPTTATSLGYVS